MTEVIKIIIGFYLSLRRELYFKRCFPEGKNMKGWRSKLVLLLLVYTAGFLTCVYFFVPPEDSQAAFGTAKKDVSSKAAQAASSAMHKIADVVQEQAVKAAEAAKEKLDERRQRLAKN
jgi:uncharacterized protein YpmS